MAEAIQVIEAKLDVAMQEIEDLDTATTAIFLDIGNVNAVPN